jgi:hypothetical protein
MKVSLWAEIRRLHEVEHLSQAAIAQRLHCSHRTVRKALAMASPPAPAPGPHESILDRYRPQIDLMSLLRVALASAVVWAVERLWSPTGLVVPVSYGLLGALYVGMLLILGEVHMQDLAVARRWLSFSKASRR